MPTGNGGIAGVTRGAGYEAKNKFGANFTMAAFPATIWAHDGPFPFLDAGIPMDFKSSVAADTIAGTGAQKVRFTYYTTDNTKVVVEKDMDGITPVQLADEVKICTRIEVIQSGSGATNAGEINLVDRASGLIVYQSVEIGEGQTLSAIQICPKDKKGLVCCHRATYAKANPPQGDVDMRLNLRKANGTIQVKHPVLISVAHSFDDVDYGEGGIEMEEGDIIYWQAIGGDIGTPIEARMDMKFEDV